jgi:parvulin-like peptidyl-prolyl isomerase
MEDFTNYLNIPGYDGDYRISPTGDVISLKKNKISKLKNTITKNGYVSIKLSKKGQGKQTFELIHRLVYLTFIGEIPQGLEIDHIDRDKLNNNISNLRIATRSENMQNKKPNGYFFDRKKWRACIKINKARIYLGSFDSEEEAKLAYEEAKKKYHIC